MTGWMVVVHAFLSSRRGSKSYRATNKQRPNPKENINPREKKWNLQGASQSYATWEICHSSCHGIKLSIDSELIKKTWPTREEKKS